MGHQLQELEEERRGYAESILIEASAILRCEDCNDLYDADNSDAVKRAYRIAAKRFKETYANELFDGNLKKFNETIDHVKGQTDNTCHHRKEMKKD